MHRPLFLLAALLAAALAGCTDDGDDGEPGAELLDTTADDQSPADDTGADAEDDGVPPTMPSSIERSLTFTSNALAGVAPFNVTFSLEATDAGNATAWSLDLGDDEALEGPATDLPLLVNHTYAEAGNLTAVATVTYNDGTELNETLAFSIEAGAPPAGQFVRDETFTFTETIVLGTQGDGIAVFSGCGVTNTVDIAEVPWPIPTADEDGTPLAVGAIHVLMTLDNPTNVDTDLFLYDPAGEEIGAATAFNLLDGPEETIEVAGPLPAGDYNFLATG
ncbi:MAG: PKD domain-containing protein, partial [Thermoplasmatota archaeon]